METMDHEDGISRTEQHIHLFDLLEGLSESLDIAMEWVGERNVCEKEPKIETAEIGHASEIIMTKGIDEETYELADVPLESIDDSPVMIAFNTNSAPERIVRVKEEDQECSRSIPIENPAVVEYEISEIASKRARRSCAQRASYEEVADDDYDQSSGSDDSDFDETKDDEVDDDLENDEDEEEMPVLEKFISFPEDDDSDDDEEMEGDDDPHNANDKFDGTIREEDEEEEIEDEEVQASQIKYEYMNIETRNKKEVSEEDEDDKEMPVLKKCGSDLQTSDDDDKEEEGEQEEAPPSPKENPNNGRKQDSVWSTSEQDEEKEIEENEEDDSKRLNEHSDDENREKGKRARRSCAQRVSYEEVTEEDEDSDQSSSSEDSDFEETLEDEQKEEDDDPENDEDGEKMPLLEKCTSVPVGDEYDEDEEDMGEDEEPQNSNEKFDNAARRQGEEVQMEQEQAFQSADDNTTIETRSMNDSSEEDGENEEMPALNKCSSVWSLSEEDDEKDEDKEDSHQRPKENPDNKTRHDSIWSMSEDDDEEEEEEEEQKPSQSTNENSDDENREKYKCDECGNLFTTAGTLRVHKLTHLEDEAAKRPYNCDQCDKRYTQAGSLSVHKRIHWDKDDPRLLKFAKIWKCEVCERVLATRTHLFVHRKTHFGDKALKEMDRKRPHKCSFCDKRFGLKKTLQGHELLHTGDYPFKCELCQLGFSKKVRLDRHIANHEKGTAKKRRGLGPKCHLCALCPRRFRKNYELAAHLKRHADDTVGSSSEDESDEEVVAKKAEDPVKCELCGNTYYSLQSYKNHKRRVYGYLEFPCSLCKRAFSLKGGLARHMKSEHGMEMEMPPPKVRAPCTFKCKYCPAAFPTEFALGEHIKQHRPASFNCGDCGEKFRKFSALDAHKKSAHGPNPYKCSHCGIRYQEHEQLMEHKKLSKKMMKAGYPEGCATQKSSEPARIANTIVTLP